MAASEINQRLDYLISYSSQLVFVCSDKINSPTQIIEDYLSEQNEQAELALLTANELTPLVTYREKLFRQLISQEQQADFNQPLNQLLARLNQQSGPIVISLFQADKLPNKLVKELWDLVLQSRFANNKHQLNVLLVGHSSWAKQIQPRLGAKSKAQPIILNCDLATRPQPQAELSELDHLIQTNRKKFAQRIQARNASGYTTKSNTKKGWLAALSIGVFSTTFAGLLSWQYPDKRDAGIAMITALFVSPPAQLTQANNEQLEQQPSTITGIETAPEDKSPSAALPANSSSVQPQNVPKKSTQDPLVTDWASATAGLEQRANQILAKLEQQTDLQAQDQQANLTKPESNNLPPLVTTDLELTEQTAEAEADSVVDYSIPDYATATQALGTDSAPANNQEAEIDAAKLSTDFDVLSNLSDNHFVIQIAGMADYLALQQFVSNGQLNEQVWVYKTQRYGGDWYVLLLDQSFTSIQAARAAIAGLPETMAINTPFVKSVNQVKKELAQSNLQS